MIEPTDRGFTLGDGLFETLLARDGRLVDRDAHLDRMAAGCLVLGLPPLDRPAATRAMDEALAGAPAGLLAVRLTLTAGSGGRGLDRPAAPSPMLAATVAPAPPPTGPATLVTAAVRRNDGSPTSRLKTLSYLDNVLARAQARAAGADEAVMLNTRGEVACAAAANLFWVAGGTLFTPALDCGVLAGVTRAQALEAARALGVRVAEVTGGPEALAAAEAVMITSSLIGVRAAASLDGRSLAPHGLAARLDQGLKRQG